VIIVKKLAAEFEVKFVVEAVNPFENFRGLFLDVLFVIESRFLNHFFSPLMNA